MVFEKSEKVGERKLPLREAIRQAGPRPDVSASRAEKKHYAELVSKEFARAVASELRRRGLAGALPKGSTGKMGGGEKRIAGGLGDKKVDVTFSTDRAGLVLAIS